MLWAMYNGMCVYVFLIAAEECIYLNIENHNTEALTWNWKYIYFGCMCYGCVYICDGIASPKDIAL